MGSGLGEGMEGGGLGLMAIGVSTCGLLCWTSKSRTGPTTKAEGATGVTSPFAGVSRSVEGAGADVGS